MCEFCKWEMLANDIDEMLGRGEGSWAIGTLMAIRQTLDQDRHAECAQREFVNWLKTRERKENQLQVEQELMTRSFDSAVIKRGN